MSLGGAAGGSTGRLNRLLVAIADNNPREVDALIDVIPPEDLPSREWLSSYARNAGSTSVEDYLASRSLRQEEGLRPISAVFESMGISDPITTAMRWVPEISVPHRSIPEGTPVVEDMGPMESAHVDQAPTKPGAIPFHPKGPKTPNLG